MIELFVTSQGLVRFLYDESLPMREIGPPEFTERAMWNLMPKDSGGPI